MTNVEVSLPTAIGEPVMVAGHPALVIAWRLVCPRFLLGGALDPAPELFLLVLTAPGDERWVEEGEVTGLGAPVAGVLGWRWSTACTWPARQPERRSRSM